MTSPEGSSLLLHWVRLYWCAYGFWFTAFWYTRSTLSFPNGFNQNCSSWYWRCFRNSNTWLLDQIMTTLLTPDSVVNSLLVISYQREDPLRGQHLIDSRPITDKHKSWVYECSFSFESTTSLLVTLGTERQGSPSSDRDVYESPRRPRDKREVGTEWESTLWVTGARGLPHIDNDSYLSRTAVIDYSWPN